MANRQIYQLDTKTLDITDVIPVQDVMGSMEAGKASLQDLQDVVLKQPVQTITVQGVDTGTTAVLIYGVNVIDTVTITDFCARLPLTPLKGKSVIVVNTSNLPVRVFPSVAGGKINGVVDGYFDVPANSLPYTFVCYENPNPGYWGTTSTARSNTNTLTYADLVVTHTQGADTSWAGTNGSVISPTGIGSGIDTNDNLTLTPDPVYWKSENFVAQATTLRIYTNIVASDFNGSYMEIGMSGAEKYDVNASTSGTRGSVLASDYCVYNPATGDYCNTVSGGVLNSPPEIGDAGTYYFEFPTLAPSIGLGGQFSRAYYIFDGYIYAGMVSKDYKFRYELDYV